MEKENYIETIINSTNGITKVTPSDDLFSKIELRIQSTTTVSAKTLWLVAASIVILLTINVSVIMKNKTTSESQIATSLAATLTKSNQLY
jgi:hypothetical protein